VSVANRLGCELKIIQGEDLNTQGFGGIYGVGKASEHPPALVIMSHTSKTIPKDAKSICLVGKGTYIGVVERTLVANYIKIPKPNPNPNPNCKIGIVYDTGGLSIKTPGSSMAGMKTDMGGSAAVLG
jgi:probable aminopeptidase NPEPL1